MRPLLLLLLFFGTALGSHFRGGIFTWKHLSGNEVQVTHRMSWRNTYYTPVCDDSYKTSRTQRKFGSVSCFDGCSSWSSPSITSVCTDYSTSEDWATYEGEFNVTLPSSSTSFFIGYTSCCWISTLLLNADSSWTIGTRIDLAYRQDIGRVNTSPVTAMQPIVRLQRGCSHSIKIPVADDDGDDIRCRWAVRLPTDECNGICGSLPGFVLHQSTCTLNYSASTSTTGYYAVAIQIEDFASSSSSTPLSSIPLQFLVKIFDSNIGCASAPTFISPTPPNGGCYEAVQGVALTIEIRIRTGTTNQRIAEVTTQTPIGVTKSSIQSISSTEYYVILSWTPTSTQQGSYIICFTAEDNLGLTTESRCITWNAVRSSTLPTIVSGTQYPTGLVYGDNRNWSVQYSNYFVRPSTSTYIRFYQSSGVLVEIIDATSSAVVYPQSTSGRQLSFTTAYNYQRGITYYIRFDEGIANKELGCSVKSPAITSTTFWTFSIYYVRCSDQPCLNSISCTDLVGDYSCLCRQGFTDKNCSTNINECASYPCLNSGTCTDGINSFFCTCDMDHYGTRCENRYIGCRDAPCQNGATCSDVIGGYMCHCPGGYSGINCSTAKTECLNATATCSQNCGVFSDGSEYCFCRTGYELDYKDNKTCIDIDECSFSNVCHPNAKCSNTVGSYICECNPGYTGDGKNCTDVNECIRNVQPCDTQATCENTIGSYQCSCNPGFHGNGQTCIENNECSEKTHDCHANASCTNTFGNFYCECYPGFFGSGKNCTDVNECQDGSNKCHLNATCYNSVGNYSCECDIGFSGNGFHCQECQNMTYGVNCKNQCLCNTTNTRTCNRENGICMCKDGWTGNTCDEDIPECTNTPEICGPHSLCIELQGSYQCLCEEGYQMSANLECQNIDECALGRYTCDHNAACRDTIGSYTCSCNLGYTGDGHSCSDVNECKDGFNKCHLNATCYNYVGNHSCECDLGFSGNGFHCQECQNMTYGVNCKSQCLCNTSNTRTCNRENGTCMCKDGWTGNTCDEDIPECTNTPQICGPNARCIEVQGSYQCLCQEGYQMTASLECQNINECNTTRHNCHTNAHCNDTEGHYTCSCKSGFTGNGTYCTAIPMTPSNVSNEEEKYTVKMRFAMTINQLTLDEQYLTISRNMKSALTSFYQPTITGFQRVIILHIRVGSLIVEHELVTLNTQLDQQKSDIISTMQRLNSGSVKIIYENKQQQITSLELKDPVTEHFVNISSASACTIYEAVNPCPKDYQCSETNGQPACSPQPQSDSYKLTFGLGVGIPLVATVIIVIIVLVYLKRRGNTCMSEPPRDYDNESDTSGNSGDSLIHTSVKGITKRLDTTGMQGPLSLPRVTTNQINETGAKATQFPYHQHYPRSSRWN